MELGGVSTASFSQAPLAEAAGQAQVSVLKKQLDQEGDVAQQLIGSATASTPAPTRPGVGEKLNVTA